MQSTAKHTRFFRRVYNFAPCGDVECSIMVCIGNVSTMFATKAFPFSFTNPKTNSAHLRSISRWNNKQLNAFKLGFVSQILTKLVKAPSVQFCFQGFAFWLCCFADIAQIFDSNTPVFTYCFFYYLLCYGVVVYGNEPTLSTTKPFQEFFCSFSAFALNAGSYFRILFANLFKLFGIEISAIGQGTYINLPKIAADKFFHIFHIIFHHINRLKQVKFPLSKQQICFAFDVRKVVRIMADKGHFEPAANRPDGNDVVGFVGKDATVIRNRAKRLESTLYFPVQFVGISDLRYATDNHLAAQIRSTLNRMVRSIVQAKLLKGFLFPRYIGNQIAGIVCFFDCLKQRLSLFIGGQQLYFQSEFHKAKIKLFQVQENILLTLKAMGVVAYLPPTPSAMGWVSRSFL